MRLDCGYFQEHFSPTEESILTRFFTNIYGPVYAVINLPEVVKGALFARYSRSPKSLRRLFLDEFIENPDLGMHVIDAMPAQYEQVGTERATKLYERVFTEYGDDSVAQIGGVHVACEQASNILTKVLEWGRLAAYLEQSTRYIFYDKKLGGRYRYLVPEEIATTVWRDEYMILMDWLFGNYSKMARRLLPYYEIRYPKSQKDSEYVWKSSIRAKVCDDLRGLLPAATLSNVGIFASGQSYETLLLRMRTHPLQEVRWYADLLLTELRNVIPAFMRRIDMPDRGGKWAAYLTEVAAKMHEIAQELELEPEPRAEVTLIEWDDEAEAKVAAAALYAYTNLPDDQLLAFTKRLDYNKLREIITSYVGHRQNRRHKPGRGLERVYYRFDIMCDYGIFRDLQRHRILTIEWQRFTPSHGYVTPESIVDISADDIWTEAMERTAAFYHTLETEVSPLVAQYVLPFAYKVRFYVQLNAREAFHLLELRTASGGHPGYRRICQEMHRLIKEQAGHRLIADAMQYIDFNKYELTRLSGERQAAARRAAQGMSEPED